jgi:hypothetical protein
MESTTVQAWKYRATTAGRGKMRSDRFAGQGWVFVGRLTGGGQ